MIVNRNYTSLWAGKTVSLTGDFVFDTTVLLWVATVLLRGDPNAPSSVLTLSYHLPSTISVLLAGVVVTLVRRIDVVFAAAGLLILVAGGYTLCALRADSPGERDQRRRRAPAAGPADAGRVDRGYRQ
jgi:hypothetical protein